MNEVCIPRALAADKGMTSRGVKVYVALAANGFKTGLSAEDVAHLSGLSVATTYRALEDLERAGWITDERVPGGDRR